MLPYSRRWLSFCGGLLAILLVNHAGLEVLHRQLPTNRAQEMLDAPAGDFDVVVLGSSASVEAIDAEELEQQLNVSVRHLGARGTAYPEQHLILDLFLNQNRAKTLLFQVDSWGLSSTSYSHPFHEYFYLPFLDHPIIRRGLREYYGDGVVRRWAWVPMFKYAEFNSEMGTQAILKAWRASKNVRDKPRYVRSKRSLPEALIQRVRQGGMRPERDRDRTRQAYFERIVQLAQQRGMRVVFCVAPVFGARQERAIGADDEVLEFYRQYARERGIAIYEWGASDCDDPTLFADLSHLNAHGAERFTDGLAQCLRMDGRGSATGVAE